MIRNNFFIIFIFLLISNICSANQVARFKQAALSYLDQAESMGHSNIEGISLKAIRRATEEVIVVHEPYLTVGVGNRRCAMWQSAANNVQTLNSDIKVNFPAQIFINNHCTQLSDSVLGSIAVHEVLGAKFNCDFNYEITTRLSLPPIAPNAELLIWKENRIKIIAGGGSTGVGGGGDDDDLKFKLAGLKMLETLKDSNETLFGISVIMLREAIFQMRVAPAVDISSFMEFRARRSNYSEDLAVAFVHSHFYRSNNADLGLWALYAARLFVIYAPYDLGFVDKITDESVFTLQQLINLKKELVKKDALSVDAYSFETQMIRHCVYDSFEKYCHPFKP